jgi:flavin-dependent dehydrogenase
VPLPACVALSRAAFDGSLVEAAIQAGAHFLPQTRAGESGLLSAGRTVRLVQAGRRAVVSARVVLVALGLGGGLSENEAGLRARVEPGSRIGAGVVVEEAPAFYHPGTVFMACGAGGYVGLVRLEDGRLNVAAALDPAALRRGRPGPAAAAILQEVDWPTDRTLAGAAWRGTPALTRRAAHVAAERLFVLGDAAGYVEPFTGEGMAWALAGGTAVAPLAIQAARAWRPDLMNQWAALHQRRIACRQTVCRLTARVLRHPVLARGVIGLLAHAPGLAGPALRRLNQGDLNGGVSTS